MKKIIAMGMLAFLAVSCASGVKNADSGDIFTELRKLNLVDEKALTPEKKQDHDKNKQDLNQRLVDFLAQPENTTDFPSLEDEKHRLSDGIIAFNKQDESQLTPDELADTRNQRGKDIDDLQKLLDKARLFMELKNLNKVDESTLTPEEKFHHEAHKKDLSSQLEDFLNREENHSPNAQVESRKAELLAQLKDINAQDETTLDPEGVASLRKNREDAIQELLGLLDGSIVPEEPQEEAVEPDVQVEPEPETPQQEEATEPEAPLPAQEETVEPQEPAATPEVDQPRGELFEELLKLNTVDEASLDPNEESKHDALKQDLNRELKETLAKDENKLLDPAEETEKNDLADELTSLNGQQEAQANPDDLQQLRDRRTQIVERLQDLLKNGKRHESVEYGIVSEKPQGITVTQEPRGAVDVVFNNLLFAFNKTDLRPSVRRILNRVASYLKNHPDFRADIGGHSDNIGPEWAKEKVANGRADNAKKYLVQAGIEESRLGAQGYSDKEPIAKPFTSSNRRKNRRVEIHILAPPAPEEEPESSSDENVDAPDTTQGPETSSTDISTPDSSAQEESPVDNNEEGSVDNGPTDQAE